MGGKMGAVASPERSLDVKVRLFLEGKDDVDVLWRRWIKELPSSGRDLPEIQRVEAAEGCSAVIDRVNGDLSDLGVIAMGILDRDALLQPKWLIQGLPVFLERDDQEFGEQAPAVFGQQLSPRLWVLPYWEMENLVLLSPKLLREHQEVRGAKRPAEVINDDVQAAERLIDLAERLRPYWAAKLHAHERGEPFKVKDVHDARRSASELRQAIAGDCAAGFDSERLTKLEQALAAFDDGVGLSPMERWRRICRAVDGKLMLSAISANWIQDSVEPMKRALALLMSKESGPPAELRELIQRLRERAKVIARRPAPSADVV